MFIFFFLLKFSDKILRKSLYHEKSIVDNDFTDCGGILVKKNSVDFWISVFVLPD